jgi:predicted MFS family arabinose efflux permease
MITIVVPLLVLRRFGMSEAVVGALFAVSGVAGVISVFFWGRIDSRGREWPMLVWSMLGLTPAVVLIWFAVGADPVLGLVLLGTALAVQGLANGPLDIALFTVRQPRTDPAWMGRAFAVSMAFNFAGFPIGAAIAGVVAEISVEASIAIGALACLVAAWVAATVIPRDHPEPAAAG